MMIFAKTTASKEWWDFFIYNHLQNQIDYKEMEIGTNGYKILFYDQGSNMIYMVNGNQRLNIFDNTRH